MDDAALVARIAARDEHAVETLSERFRTVMHAVAMRVTHNERLTEEVVQDALMAVWRDPSRYDTARGALGPWLLTLTRYKAIDAMRREQVIQKRSAVVDLELREAPDNVHDEVWRNVRRERLYEAIQRLGPDQRRALELAFIGGLTHVEVAEREGLPLGTAKTRIRMALLKLREYLADSVVDEVRRDADPGGVGPSIRVARGRIPVAADTAAPSVGRSPPIHGASRHEPGAVERASEASGNARVATGSRPTGPLDRSSRVASEATDVAGRDTGEPHQLEERPNG